MKSTSERIQKAMLETKKKCTAGTVRILPVSGHPEFYQVELHDNPILIGRWGEYPQFCTLAGWNTVTTVSRINDLTKKAYVTNRDYTPYLYAEYGVTVEMSSSGWYRLSDCRNFGNISPSQVVDAINSKEEAATLLRLRSDNMEKKIIGLEEDLQKERQESCEWIKKVVHAKDVLHLLKEEYTKQNDLLRELVAKMDAVCYKIGVRFDAPVVADVKNLMDSFETEL